MRLFVALELPGEVRSALGEIARRLRPASAPGVRWSDPNGIHLTLKFIGVVERAKAQSIRAALAGVRAPRAVSTAFRGLGWFPNARHPRVLWVGVEADSGLGELAAGIEQVLEPLGIPRETREFRPHLTLARIKEEKGLERLRQEVERLGAPELGSAVYGEFDLMASTLRPQGAVYTRLERFAFAPAAAEAARPDTAAAPSLPLPATQDARRIDNSRASRDPVACSNTAGPSQATARRALTIENRDP
jgi:2'-5' RNA ligase